MKWKYTTNNLYPFVYVMVALACMGGVILLISLMNSVAPPAAYQCPADESKYLEEHIVTFVVINAEGQPYENVLIRCTQGSLTQDVVTRADGSCSVLVKGDQECIVSVYNKSAEPEKEFRLYPVQSCYSLILEGKRDEKQ